MALLVGAPAARGAGIDAHRAAIPAHDGVTGGLVDDVPDTRSSEAVVGAHVGLEGQPAVRSTGDAEPELVVGDALTTRFQAVAFPLEPLGLTARRGRRRPGR